MAGENSNSMLDALTNQQLQPANGKVPAVGGERDGKDPVDPGQSREVVQGERGRTPDQVLGEREEQKQTRIDDDEPIIPIRREAKKSDKVKIGDKELTLEELRDSGQLDAIIKSAMQLPSITKAHQAALEKLADLHGKELATKSEPAPVARRGFSQEQIRQAYAPMLKQYVEAGHIEPDFAEAYPDMATGMMFRVEQLETLIAKVTQILNWIAQVDQARNQSQVMGRFTAAINEVAANKDKLYDGLRDSDMRAEFEKWLREEVDPKVGQLTPEYIERQWVAYNAKAIIEFTKRGREAPKNPKRASGDGAGSRNGTPETPTEPGMLDRMIEQFLPGN